MTKYSQQKNQEKNNCRKYPFGKNTGSGSADLTPLLRLVIAAFIDVLL